MYARSEAVYDTHFVPLRVVTLHQGTRKGTGPGHLLRQCGLGFATLKAENLERFSGFRVWGSGLRAEALRCLGDLGLGFWLHGLMPMVWDAKFRDVGVRVWVYRVLDS